MTRRKASTHRISCLTVFLGLGLLASADLLAGAQQTFCVSPSGSDQNPGTQAKPFRTVTRARDAVRTVNANMKGDVVVLLRGGTYEIDRTVTFDHRDAGTGGHCVIYKAHADETPVISGGKRIMGWQRDSANRWKAKTDIPDFRQLYVDGVRAVRARGGALPGAALHGEDGYTTSLAEMADWRNPGDIELCYYVVWTHTRCKVNRITRQGARAVITMRQPWFTIARKKEGVRIKLPAYVENAFELLDAPGEWYLDRAADVVYYIPKPGQDMTTAEVIAPTIERPIELKGTIDKPVHHIRFEGITFAYAGWLRPNRIGHVDVQANFIMGTGQNMLKRKHGWTMVHNEHVKSPSNIVCRAARSIRFERCTFTKLGSGGIDLEHGAQDNVICGCHFHDISGTAIQVGDVLRDDHHPDDPRKVVRNNQVINNTIHDVCVEYMGGVGVFAGVTQATRIAHNQIYHLPYTSVSVGWGWGEEDAGGGAAHYYQPFRYDKPTPAQDHRIEFNHIHHVMQTLTDGGGIYTLSNQPRTVIRGNHIHDANGSPGGIYLDEGSGFIEVTGNCVYKVRRPMNFNNRVQNRIATCNVHDNAFGVGPGSTRGPGKVGSGLLCDGANFHAVPHAAELEPLHLAVTAWIRASSFPSPTSKDPRRWIVNKNTHEFTESHYALMIDHTKVGAYLNIGGGQPNCYEAWSPAGALAPDRWHHLAMTYDGAVLKAYLDGKPVASKTINKKRIPGNTPLHIGGRQDGYNYYEGLIDEVSIYNRALSPDEVKANWQRLADAPSTACGTPAVKDGLVAHWGFDKPAKIQEAVKRIVAKAGLEPAYRRTGEP